MRKSLLTLALLALALPAAAGWTVGQDGAAIIENDGDASLALWCNNNANTGNRPGWRLELTAVGLNQLGPRTEIAFRFPNRAPMRLLADHRLGQISIDSMELATQSDLTTLVSRLKAASRVTITVSDTASDNAFDPLTFSLSGSSRAITAVRQACH